MINQSTYIAPLDSHARSAGHFFGYDTYRWRHVTQKSGGDDRDWQRTKVYEAEWEFDWSPESEVLLTFDQTVAFVEKVLHSSVVASRWGSGRDMRVEYSNRRRGAIAWKRRIAFGGDMMKPYVILHEIAHTLCPAWEHHGRLFVRTYLELIGWFLGADEKKRFKAQLRAKKVKMSPRRAA